ncbi:MAG: PAS domain-containing protein, partial [Verrucomicrobiota bacterium]
MTIEPIRILVVDDDADIARGTARVLEKAGYTTATTLSGEDTLLALPTFRPQLVVLDLDMPGMDGLEVCRRIKADPAYAEVFVILITGTYTQTEEQLTGLESGADGYLMRPISNRELTVRIEAFIRILRLNQALREKNEELAQSYSLLTATLESTADGILVVDSQGKVTSFNQKFLRLWKIPPDLMAAHNDQLLLQHVQAQLAEPAAFIAKVEELYRNPQADSSDELRFVDGRVFTRYSQPQRLGDKIVGRVWPFRDITARKQAELALAIRVRVAAIFASVPDAEMYHEVLNVLLDVSHSPFGVFGYIDADGANVVPTMTREVWDKCQIPEKTIRFPRDTWGDSSWPRALREKRSLLVNTPSSNIPGGHVAIQRHISLPILFQGEAIGLFQVANKETDYTPDDLRTLESIATQVAPLLHARLLREQAELALRESEHRLNFALEMSHLGTWDLDLQNHTAQRSLIHDQIFGYPALLPHWTYEMFLDHVLPEDRAHVDHAYRTAVAAQEYMFFECRIRRTDNEVRWIWCAGGYLRNAEGQPVRMIGLVQDITERKQAEQVLREREAQLRFVTDHAPLFLVQYDHERRYKFANEPYLKVFGLRREEIIGKHAREVLGEAVYALACPCMDAALAGQATEYDLTLPLPAGPRMVHARYVPEHDASGRVIGLIVAILDVTEHKKLEEQFLRAQRLENLGSLAGGIAHDLNNVLTPVLIAVPQLRKEVGDPSSRSMLDAMETSAQRGSDIIKQLLTFARGTPGVQVSLPVRPIQNELVNIIQETFPRNIEPRLDVPNDLWPVQGDTTQLHQALLNLCINARDALPEGGT